MACDEERRALVVVPEKSSSVLKLRLNSSDKKLADLASRPLPSFKLLKKTPKNGEFVLHFRVDLDEVLGCGGYGTVYRGTWEPLKKISPRLRASLGLPSLYEEVVLKVYFPDLGSDTLARGFGRYVRGIVDRNSQAPRSLSRILWEGFAQEDDEETAPCFARVLQPVGAVDLFQALVQELPLLQHEKEDPGPTLCHPAAALVLELWEALSYLHEHMIVHRDIKLENVILVPSSKQPREPSDREKLGHGCAWYPVVIDYDLAAPLGSLCCAHGTLQASPPKLQKAIAERRRVLICASHDLYGLTYIMKHMLICSRFCPPSHVATTFLATQLTRVLKVVLPQDCKQSSLQRLTLQEICALRSLLSETEMSPPVPLGGSC